MPLHPRVHMAQLTRETWRGEGCVGFTCTIYYVGAKINGLTDCYWMAWRMSGTHIRPGAEEASCGRFEVLPRRCACTLFMSSRSRAVYDNPFMSSLIKPYATYTLFFSFQAKFSKYSPIKCIIPSRVYEACRDSSPERPHRSIRVVPRRSVGTCKNQYLRSGTPAAQGVACCP